MAIAVTNQRRRKLVGLLLCAVVAGWAGPVSASPISPTGTLLPPKREAPSPKPSPSVGVGVPGSPAPTVSVGKPSNSPDGRGPSRPTVLVRLQGPCLVKEGVYAPDGTMLEPPVGGYLIGTGVVDPNGKVTSVFGIYCAGERDAPPPPPPPPAAEDVWQEFPLAGGDIGVSPSGSGLTGLPTGLWYSGLSDGQTITTNVRGYAVTATARPVRYTWSFGDDTEDVASSTAGSDDPAAGVISSKWAASHVYEKAGDYTLTVTVTWSGTYEWAGAGLGGTGNLGGLDVTVSRTYHVREARGVLAG